jgi:5-(hydroxymethyl)furfural/furfural oxidase
VLASRLSENANIHVTLIEAGRDFSPSQTPDDILATYPGRALGNRSYFWKDCRITRGNEAVLGAEGRRRLFYEQACVIGGGSNINGQVALRGTPDDFNRWAALGARGWNWSEVEPYFKRLETDMDFPESEAHGAAGPIRIHRHFRDKWDPFTQAVAQEWEKSQLRYNPDMNGEYEDGFFPIPTSNDGAGRSSASIGYLTDAVRARSNLEILGQTVADRVLFEGRRAVGVSLRGADGAQRVLRADRIVVSAGAFRSPFLLLKSGIGPGAHLSARGIEVVADRAGVGRNLQDHPMISISAWLHPSSGGESAPRRNFAYMRYTSGLADRDSDMVMMAICRSSWHAIGRRIGTLAANLGYAFSRGHVELDANPNASAPAVTFNWLADERDRARMMHAFERMAGIYRADEVLKYASNHFPSSYNARAKLIQRSNKFNDIITRVGARVMTHSGLARKLIIDNVIRDAPRLDTLLADRGKLEDYVCRNVASTFHPSGTCKMGSPDDFSAVTDPSGAVIGTENLFVADASLMPEVTRTNTNIPTIMIAEKLSAQFVKAA